MKKLFISLLALVVSVVTIFASDTQVDGIWYRFNSSTQTAAVTFKGDFYDYYSDDYSGVVNIPSSVTYNNISYSVTSITAFAFWNCRGLTSVTIPNSVTSIGEFAFQDCSSLTSVILPNGLTSINYMTFQNCINLASITIPNSVTSITAFAFQNCSGLTTLTVPNSVTSIGEQAFDGCTHVQNLVWEVAGEIPIDICSQMTELTDITIGKDVTNIKKGTFDGCLAISSVVWNAKNCPTIEDENGIYPPFLYSAENITSFTFGNDVEVIPVAICKNMSKITSLTIGNSVTSIGDSAFYHCSGLTSVTIPNSVTYIGDEAFILCESLTSVTIGNSVTSIGNYAFSYCTGLTSVTIPNSVTSIGDDAFRSCTGLTSVTIGNSVASIGEGAFSSSPLTSVTIPNSITSIGNYAFKGCSDLTSVTIEAETPPILKGKDVFTGGVYDGELTYPIYVPCTSVNAYKWANNWNYYRNRILGEDCVYYTITFVNWDGSVLRSTQVVEGRMPNYTGTTPTRPDDEEYTYTFSGWTPTIVAATADATYTANFTETEKPQPREPITVRLLPNEWNNVYLYAWTGNGETQPCGAWPGTQVSKDAEGWWTHTFDSSITNINIIWNNGTNQTVNIDGVTESTCYSLNSTSGKTITVSTVDCVYYTITFVNWDGSVLQSSQVEEGRMPNYTGATPIRPDDEEYTYTFSGWTPTIVAAAANATYTATFDATLRKYIITFLDEDGAELCKEKWEYGAMPTCTEPQKDTDEQYIYTFAGWSPDVVAVVSDATYTATYTSTPKSEGIDDVQSDDVRCTKVLRNGQILIQRGEKIYTLQGQEVK